MNVVHLVSNRVWGGGEQYVLDLCRALDADGHSVAVVTRGYKDVGRFQAGQAAAERAARFYKSHSLCPCAQPHGIPGGSACA